MLGYKDASFVHLVESFPCLLSLPIESHVKPLVQFFESLGIPHRRVRNIILLFPPIIFYKANDISKKVLVFQKVFRLILLNLFIWNSSQCHVKEASIGSLSL